MVWLSFIYKLKGKWLKCWLFSRYPEGFATGRGMQISHVDWALWRPGPHSILSYCRKFVQPAFSVDQVSLLVGLFLSLYPPPLLLLHSRGWLLSSRYLLFLTAGVGSAARPGGHVWPRAQRDPALLEGLPSPGKPPDRTDNSYSSVSTTGLLGLR